MSLKDYYKLLNVDPTASAEEVKRAFRSLVKQYHPDSGADEANPNLLLEIKEAYAVLSSEERRSEYDKSYRQVFVSSISNPFVERNGNGVNTSSKIRPEKPVDPEDDRRWGVFEKLNEEILSKATPEEPIQPEDDEDTDESEGGSILSKISDSLWRKPKGRSEKAMKEEAKKPPQTTRPRRKTIERKRIYNFTISALEAIVGTTREIAFEDTRGEVKVLKVKIPPDTRNATLMRLAYGKEGSLKPIQFEIMIKVVAAEFFEIVDDDIIMHVPVTVSEAARGDKISVPTIFGTQLVLLPSPCARGSEIRLPNHGLKKKDQDGRGDLRIRPFISLPTHLSKSSIDAAKVIDEDYPGDVRIRLPKFTG
jgi:molecular chaperone DnaJ